MNDAGHVSSVQPRSLLCTAQYIAWHAGATPGATAIVEAGVRVTYGELAADLLRYVCALQSIPIRPGMLVGVAVGFELANELAQTEQAPTQEG